MRNQALSSGFGAERAGGEKALRDAFKDERKGSLWERSIHKILGLDIASSEQKRQRFRRFLHRETGRPREFCGRLHNICCRWLKPEERTKKQMVDLVILELFLNGLPPELGTWLRECGSFVYTVEKMCKDLRGDGFTILCRWSVYGFNQQILF
ncbi:hypothetical protein JD844_013905 [Phrynosoma platyrhinos]|uniref:SCAN box domain-containing protein n=1 Tax=Phrynosoma platyrhinos TaxID=52577 RepID=A0ABQ7TMH3_PHRPL|nr:hypothetical protein JD844_013905 [Phrynosoma platyrhinos]